ncbi:MAG TPA: hypothetical protein VHC69_13365 [Polyangiaceae bacterium]|nr:hypothetical protein [Polyangiaceae bacterium]
MKSNVSRIGLSIVLTSILGSLLQTACHQGDEGDRCNPFLSAGHDECGSGLQCGGYGTMFIPINCPENYCCPKDGKSDNPNCQPGCNGGDVTMCAAEATGGQPLESFCADLCKDSANAAAPFCTMSSTMPAVDGGTAPEDAGKDH